MSATTPDLAGLRQTLYNLLNSLDAVGTAFAYEAAGQASAARYPLATVWLEGVNPDSSNPPLAEFGRGAWNTRWMIRFFDRLDGTDGQDAQRTFDALIPAYIAAIYSDLRAEAYDTTLDSGTRIELVWPEDNLASVINDINGNPIAVQWDCPVTIKVTVNT